MPLLLCLRYRGKKGAVSAKRRCRLFRRIPCEGSLHGGFPEQGGISRVLRREARAGGEERIFFLQQDMFSIIPGRRKKCFLYIGMSTGSRALSAGPGVCFLSRASPHRVFVQECYFRMVRNAGAQAAVSAVLRDNALSPPRAHHEGAVRPFPGRIRRSLQTSGQEKEKKRENFVCQPKAGIVFSEKIVYPEIWKRFHENTCYLPDKGLV